jgi:hypothetical protein
MGRLRGHLLQVSTKGPGHLEDDQPYQTPHQGSVDADVLQILADLKLQPVHQGFGIPSCHELGDECADLSAVRHDGAQDEPRSLIVALM